jgi:cysteine-rich repeat protein
VQAEGEEQTENLGPVGFGAPSVNIAGQGFSGVFPPDTVGDVGPTRYVQAINAAGGTAISGWDKSGTPVFGPNILATDLGTGVCANAAGDPIVLYDHLADRWLLSEFSAVADALCVYISQTADPGGMYHGYIFTTPNFPDYPKYAVWGDAYYVSTHEPGDSPVYALDRTAMLAGSPATFQRFTAPSLAGFDFQALTPADLDGATSPPAGAPGYFVRHRDDEVHNAPGNNPTVDFLEVWELDVDFVTPANSTFTGPTNISITEIDSDLCGVLSSSCFPQPNTQQLDPLRQVVMFRAQYRNFTTHQTLVGNLVTDVDGTDHGGIRWFELRNTGGGWVLEQEGTYAPDASHRWMGSIAMDGDGNIALGYSMASLSQFPNMRYVGRLADLDPAGSLPRGEHLITFGAESQNNERWGDYSAMSVDPVDDCTFWHTNEYISSADWWDTRIAAFKFDSCGLSPAVCGDGLIEPPESCDDGNTNDGDGCSSVCEVESGFMCSGEPSVCLPDPAEICLEENFDLGNPWTKFNTGPLNWDWGNTDDGICWSGDELGGPPAPNVTGGSGDAACIDTDATGPVGGVVEAYMCSPLRHH